MLGHNDLKQLAERSSSTNKIGYMVNSIIYLSKNISFDIITIDLVKIVKIHDALKHQNRFVSLGKNMSIKSNNLEKYTYEQINVSTYNRVK